MIMRRIIFALVVGVVFLVAVVVVRTLLLQSNQPDGLFVTGSSPSAVSDRVSDIESAAASLSAAIQIPTVTYDDTSRIDRTAFARLHELLATRYPRVHETLRRDTVGELSLLYEWVGTDSNRPPIVLTGHMDVVPVPPNTLGEWSHPPFEGRIVDDYVWGRGAIDDKGAVISILEAVERLLAQGYRPDRTVYLAFGGDEERGGYHGAALLAQVLKRRGVSASFVLDEGLFIVDGMVPGVSSPVALVGVAEKGAANLELSVETEGGHASMPPEVTAFGILSRAIDRLQANPFQAELDGVPETMFAYLAPEMGFVERAVFANLWLFSPLVRQQLAATPSSNALLRTTVAPTIVEGGTKVNVLPPYARAVLNIRLRPGDTLNDVVDYVRRTVDDDRVQLRVLEGASEASPVSPVEEMPFKTIQGIARQTFPNVVVAPALMIARTDSRHYAGISNSVFRFTPVQLSPDDLGRIHGVDERLSLEGLASSIRFYHGLIRASTSDG